MAKSIKKQTTHKRRKKITKRIVIKLIEKIVKSIKILFEETLVEHDVKRYVGN